MSLDDLWRIARRYWAILVAMSLAGVAIAWLFLLTQPERYTATTTAYVTAGATNGGNSQADKQAQAAMAYSNSMLAKQKAQAWLPVFKTTPVMESVINKLKLDTSPAALASTVSTTMDEEAPVITVSATASTPVQARDAANEIVKATADQVTKLEGSGAGAEIRLVSNAELPGSPSYPNPSRILPIGLIAGLALGMLFALAQARRDTRVRSEEDIERASGTSVLAAIPDSKGLASDGREAEREDFRTREALRQLRTNLRFVDPDNPPRAIVVTSSRMGEGKSSIASNLARVLAESGERVLLIDADLRRPMVSAILDIEPEVGLSQLIAGSVEASDVIIPTTHRNMFAVPAGQIPPNPSELLGSRTMKRIIEELRQEYFVILDAPPLLPVTDAALLLPSTDGALLVVDSMSTRKEHVEQAVRNILAVNGHVLGAVMNRAKSDKNGRYGYSKYGYGGAYTYQAYTADTSGGKGNRKVSRERTTSEAALPADTIQREGHSARDVAAQLPGRDRSRDDVPMTRGIRRARAESAARSDTLNNGE
ncbi:MULTISPECIES: polysaccharide biosynthesis tyrosine autokinase [Dermacoccus]|uniref:non-specific protein-tyrosine kinase n=2 Tax=Dermacoccus TaxID=57495 RepID=A0A417Z5F8_9MICO|nr:polysaccharide biosynthesis tyrosine autokinase [Dermacoccus abyssi]RHW45888.1 polysaccharide biosynthesis tyrosine autokinase [Dermacoccus abyssi]